VLFIDQMITREECHEMIAAAEAEVKRSEVVAVHGKSVVDNVRTSLGMFILTHVEANENFRRKVAAFAGVPIENIEATQILRYQRGQYYRAHPDYFYPNAKEHLARGGQRFATVLMWLNEVPSGGETSFPLTSPKLEVIPRGPGNAIMFYSLDAHGNVDSAATHEAHPPTGASIKWVAVAWIRQHKFT
jgi:prolyl 4-hydroxylase